MTGEKFKGIIFDLDGVLEFQGKVYPGAIGIINSLREKEIIIRILTNSTLKSRKYCAKKLQGVGFNIYESEVITASFATAKYLKSLNPRSSWVMLKGEGLVEFKHFSHDTENPEYIVLGDLREDFNFQNMNKALKLLDFTPKEINFLLDLSSDLKKVKYAGTEQARLKDKTAKKIKKEGTALFI